ncbi:MAG: SLATT domain-containing protein [Acidobacteriota bacterium]|nr:MAG: SLATT domain-containing protein [Acidobacteriota bacterium]
MNTRQRQFLSLYLDHRHKDQASFYRSRHQEYEKARSQAIILSGVLMFLASIVSLVAAYESVGEKWIWAVMGVFLPALSAAISSYGALYSFEQQAKLYQDALHALHRIEASALDLQHGADGADSDAKLEAYVVQVEEILRSEQGQWGQLISQLKPVEVPAKRESSAPAGTTTAERKPEGGA